MPPRGVLIGHEDRHVVRALVVHVILRLSDCTTHDADSIIAQPTKLVQLCERCSKPNGCLTTLVDGIIVGLGNPVIVV